MCPYYFASYLLDSCGKGRNSSLVNKKKTIGTCRTCRDMSDPVWRDCDSRSVQTVTEWYWATVLQRCTSQSWAFILASNFAPHQGNRRNNTLRGKRSSRQMVAASCCNWNCLQQSDANSLICLVAFQNTLHWKESWGAINAMGHPVKGEMALPCPLFNKYSGTQMSIVMYSIVD